MQRFDRDVASELARLEEELLSQGYIWCVDADLTSCFDTIPHDGLMVLVQQRVVDGSVLALVERCLKAGVMEGLKGWHFRGGKKWPRKKSLQKLQDRLRPLTRRTHG